MGTDRGAIPYFELVADSVHYMLELVLQGLEGSLGIGLFVTK
ncbi:MAG TPA: hypothetical protein VHZ55_21595 [Bryobacteraceae bacterium]|nr:hypothetical protein [Bryobacteraceae bacterium]